MIYIFGQFVLAYRWHLVSKHFNLKPTFKYILSEQFKINFLELLIPIPNAEDYLRINSTRRIGNISLTGSTKIIIADRIWGILSLGLLLIGTFKLYYHKLNIPSLPNFAIITILIFIILIFLFQSRINDKIKQFFKQHFNKDFDVKNQIYLFFKHFNSLKTNILLISISLSKFFLEFLTLYLLLNIFKIDIQWWMILFSIPLLKFSVVLPLSYQGIGLYEAALVLVLTWLNIDFQDAAMIGFIHFAFNILLILFGGILFIFSKRTL